MKVFILLLCLNLNKNFALDEYNLIVCQSLSHSIYNECIIIPSITTAQLSICTSIYSSYILCLEVLNMPYPITPSYNMTFSSSPFDVCKYEVGELINFDLCF